jgi:hypothetical protein
MDTWSASIAFAAYHKAVKADMPQTTDCASAFEQFASSIYGYGLVNGACARGQARMIACAYNND